MPWLALPEELILNSLNYLEIRDLLALQLTCRKLRTAIVASVELQCRLELAACGLCEGQASRTVPAADRLRRIQAHDAAWRELPWTEVLQTEHPVSNLSITVSDNVVVWRDIDDPQTLLVKQVPSALRGIEARDWELHIDCPVDQLVLDASQDLMIVGSAMAALTDYTYASVRSLSKGGVHPECSWSGRISFPGLMFGVTKLCGDRAGTTLYNPENGHTSLFMWNWKTGVQLVNSMLPLTSVPPLALPRITFVDPMHILAISDEQDSAPEAPTQLSLHLYDLSRAGTDLELTDALVGSYALPTFTPHGQWQPYFLDNYSSYPTSSSSERGIFSPDRSRKLIGVGVHSDSIHRLFVFANDIFLRNERRAGATVPWDLWGSSGVRCASASPSRWRSLVIHGMRTVEYDSEEMALIVSDYDPRRVRRAITARDNSERGLVSIRGDVIFEEEADTSYGSVKTSFPRLVNKKQRELTMGGLHRAYLCDDCSLLIEGRPRGL
ncbi:hypothetical protein FA95DRAFT_1602783 [Auriscalpium vulgare]|uniref:Uncharacterized protein n=1 Tax=Auriscalpium vulgare TaxID=40419 RepID=A0ACB8S5A3_9AGAM|nr:hypothetical protein FA95DRAFT_1602783 [Auriscalpium vulgare]